MNRILIVVVIALLSASLVTNIYLWQRLSSYDEGGSVKSGYTSSSTGNESNTNSVGDSVCGAGKGGSANCNKNPTQYNPKSTELMADAQTPSLKALTAMLEAGEYSQLAVEINNQLKLSPLSEPLLLLEAELVERTKPLPTALINYYDFAGRRESEISIPIPRTLITSAS